jgi:hypothetical protein
MVYVCETMQMIWFMFVRQCGQCVCGDEFAIYVMNLLYVMNLIWMCI